jgi:hypothetical protein
VAGKPSGEVLGGFLLARMRRRFPLLAQAAEQIPTHWLEITRRPLRVVRISQTIKNTGVKIDAQL